MVSTCTRNSKTWLPVLGLLLMGSLVLGQNAKPKGKDTHGAAPAKIAEPKKLPALTGRAEDVDIIQAIDVRIAEKWSANKLTPSNHASDYEFIRRASLDIIGRIAKPEEIQRFLKDPPEKRRALLIDRLLRDEGYQKNLANIWTVWLMTRNNANDQLGRGVYHEQMREWLEKEFAKTSLSFKDLVTELLTATGKTSENPAVNYILSHLGEPIPRAKQAEEGKFTMVPVTSRTTRLFLGLQTQCAQCHPHPFNKEFNQTHFWGVNAFFRQVDRKGMPMRNTSAVLELTDDYSLNADGIVFFEQRNGVVLPTKARFLFDGDKKSPQGENRRQELARFVTGSKYFPKAYVNRIWQHFFARGFTNPVDDFTEENEPSHPELLDELATQFASHNYDPRALIRWICNSEAYSLTSVASKNNEKADAEPFFSRMLLKAMSPEQLFESLVVATQAEMFESPENRTKLRDKWMQSLSANFGDDEGNEVTFNGTVVQALMMMNGGDINSAISSDKKGTVPLAVVTKRAPRAVLDYLYLASLNRPPTSTEASKILGILQSAPVRNRDVLSPYQDLLWALLNSNEFMLNH